MVVREIEAFLLTRQWRDGPRGLTYTLWGRSAEGPVRVVLGGQEDVLFVERQVATAAGRREALELTSLDGRPVDGVYFPSRKDLLDERDRLRRELRWPLESDVKPVERFLMERFVTGAFAARGEARQRDGYLEMRDPALRSADFFPPLRLLSLDIETDGLDGSLLSIALVTRDSEEVLMRGEGPADPRITYLPDEGAILAALVERVRGIDPDCLLGWNVVDYDLLYLQRRSADLRVDLALGRGGARAVVLEPRTSRQPYVARIPGRVVLDGIATLKSATWSFESFRLGDVAGVLLGRGKAIDEDRDAVAEIRRLYDEDPVGLAEYNLEDCRLVLEIFDRARLVEHAVERQRLTGLPLDRQGGSVAAFDHLYLPRLHRHGHVAPDVGAAGEAPASPGGYVLESRPGLYDDVLVLDFKSLYPSIIRTLRIDPMGLAFPGDEPVEGFGGARFHRDRHILPELIETLWTARDRAKQDGNAPMSQAIKILMNSFYGVLGTPGCRFFDPRLASSITRRGHEIIRRSQEWIEQLGHVVLYGDTDSLFVLVGERADEARCRELGTEMARGLNAWWRETIRREHRVQSALEVEFETHYLRFLMPTVRGSDKGSKKRYAGTVRAPDGGTRVVFKGLEAVRTDWTPLARRFQRELFRRVFAGEPWEEWVRRVADDLRAGRLDDELVYTKRLRRDVDDYATEGAPPHVQAARKLGGRAREVSYVVTVDGPEPAGQVESRIDYDHYLDRQLGPAADTLLHFLDTTFERLTGAQMSLF